MEQWYPVEYQPRTSSLWVGLALAWWLVTLANLLLALFLGNLLPLVIAAVAIAASILFTLLTPVTRRQRHGEAQLQGRHLLLRETSPWWDRVSVGGQLQLRVTAVDVLGEDGLLATGDDLVWGALRVRFTLGDAAEAKEFSTRLEGVRQRPAKGALAS